MSTKVLMKGLSDAVVSYNKEKAIEITDILINKELDSFSIINEGLIPGMDVIRQKFNVLECFLPELIIAAEIIEACIDLILKSMSDEKKSLLIQGKVVIGTPKGDIHDVGKNIFSTMLIASGFIVYDIGIDKTIDDFINKARETDADIIAMSCLMTTSLVQLKEIVEDLERLNIKDKYKVMVGGGAVQSGWAYDIGADGYSKDASDGVSIAQKLMSDIRKEQSQHAS